MIRILIAILKKAHNRYEWLKRNYKIKKLKLSQILGSDVSLYEFNEFTWDMVRTLPKAYFQKNIDKSIKLFVKPNLSSVYYFTDKVEEKNLFSTDDDSKTYSYHRPDFTKMDWFPPPIKKDFGGYFNFEKPSLIIQNKYTMEFSYEGIFNFFDLEFLDTFFREFKNKYQIIYIRPKPNQKNYYEDMNSIMPFQDYELIKNHHPEVKTIYDFIDDEPDFNILQFKLHSTSEKHLSVSGGNACLASYFGGDLVIFDSPQGKGAGRGIWKTDSWLNLLSGSKIVGFNNYNDILNYTLKKWK